MNKAELVSAVAEKSGQSAAAVGSVLAAFEDVVTSTVAGGGKVQIPGFLSFEQASAPLVPGATRPRARRSRSRPPRCRRSRSASPSRTPSSSSVAGHRHRHDTVAVTSHDG